VVRGATVGQWCHRLLHCYLRQPLATQEECFDSPSRPVVRSFSLAFSLAEFSETNFILEYSYIFFSRRPPCRRSTRHHLATHRIQFHPRSTENNGRVFNPKTGV